MAHLIGDTHDDRPSRGRGFGGIWRSWDVLTRIRFIFAVLALAYLMPLMQALLFTGPVGPFQWAVAPLPLVLLAQRWWALRLGRHPRGSLIIEACIWTVIGLALPGPAPLAGSMLGGLYFRALFGGHRQAVIGAAVYVGTVLTVAAALGSGDLLQQPLTILTWVLPTYCMATLLMRMLHAFVESVQIATESSAAIARLSTGLLTAADAGEVRVLAEECARSVIPDLVGFTVTTEGPVPVAAEHTFVRRLKDGQDDFGHLVVAFRSAQPRLRMEAVETLATQMLGALEAVRLRARLAYRANHDHLTALPNRAMFLDTLTAALTDPYRRVGVLFIDIDDFKAVNDTFGHAAGDALLADVGDRLRRSVRLDDVAARIGGDEFAVILGDLAGLGDAVLSARRVLEALHEPLGSDSASLPVNCSIGVAVSEPSTDPPATRAERLLHHADTAMYASKASGKNRYEIFEPVGSAAAEKIAWPDSPAGSNA